MDKNEGEIIMAEMVNYDTCHKECTAFILFEGKCIFKDLCVSMQLPIEREGDNDDKGNQRANGSD